jgi:hypothetical protein
MKTLVILMGNSRGSEVAWRSLYDRVLLPLNADLALVMGKGEKENSLYKRAKYTKFFDEYSDWGECIDMIARRECLDYDTLDKWRSLLLQNDMTGLWGGVSKHGKNLPGSGAIGFCMRYFAKELIIEHSLTDKYDRFIITRSDHYYISDHPLLDDKFEWIPTGEDYGGICDRHLVIRKENVVKALDVLSWCLKLKRTLPGNPEYIEYNYFNRIGLDIKRFNRTFFLVKTKDDMTRWGECESYIDYLGIYVKYKSEYTLSLTNLYLSLPL